MVSVFTCVIQSGDRVKPPIYNLSEFLKSFKHDDIHIHCNYYQMDIHVHTYIFVACTKVGYRAWQFVLL